MDAGFGARLRAHREARQLTLQGIAAQTKIKQSLLQGLECDDLSAWPKGIFRRAFVRDYARAIGLDPETVVREFLERHPDPIEQTPFGPGGAPLTESGLVQVHSEPPTRLQRLIDAARTAVPLVRRSFSEGGTLPNRVDRAPKLENGSPTSPLGTAERRDVTPPFEQPAPTTTADLELDTASVRAAAASTSVDLNALAELCTRLALVGDWEQFKTALVDTTRILHASGVMLWCRDAGTALLTPVAAHGYADAVLARLPRIHPRDDNAIAGAFRSADIRVVSADRGLTAAVAVPVMAPVGCVGVLAFEVHEGHERDSAVAAAARIIAAQLAGLLTPAENAHAETHASA